MTQRHILTGLALGAVALALSGCGDDPQPVTFQPVKPAARTGAPPPPPPSRKAFQTATADTSGDDPLAGPDPLAAGSGADAPAPDLGETPPPADDDQITAGPKMPTEHSHWLRGAIFNARVTVALNGLFLGEFRAPVDKDITMKLRRGVNTVTFTYTPQTDTSSARLDVLESEHNPPIAPLASFRSPQPAVGQPQKPLTQTVTFLAR